MSKFGVKRNLDIGFRTNGVFLVVNVPEAIFSNDLNQLLDVLIEDIQASPSLSLLAARIIVPDGSIRAWLSHELSKKSISLLRVEILLLDEALERPTADTQPLTRSHLIPLLISFLAHLQKNPDFAYLSLDTTTSQYQMARRLRLPFALRAFLGEKAWFAKDPSSEILWHTFEQWCPLSIPSIQKPSPPSSEVPLFLFGFSSLNHLLLNQFLSSPSLQCLYLVSPCMLFWGDQSSDHEMRFLLNSASLRHVARPSAEQLEQFLYDRHRLLANSGQIGREFMLLIEETHLQTRSMYVLPKALNVTPYTEYLLPEIVIHGDTTPSLLDHLKADLLLLVGKREDFQSIPHDGSIEIHGAPTPLREVEALYKCLTRFPSLPPASVIVLVTDMTRYQAAIEQVFGQEIPYQIWGKTRASSVITAFRMVVNLLMSKGTLHDWLQLLRHPVFHRTLQMTKDEAEALIDWLSSRPICWGLSPPHKNRYLASRAITPSLSPSASFEEEREILLKNLLSSSSDTSPEVSLLQPIGNFFRFLTTIESWWQLPLQASACSTMDNLSTLFDAILHELLQGSSRSFEEEALLAAGASFAKIASETGSPSLPASEALRLFYRLVDTNLSRNLLHLTSPLIVAEFGSFQPFPALLIAILGAQEGALPQHSEEQLLNRLDRMMPKIPASSTFFDRYSFLEAILEARTLFISYQSYSFETREPTPYSPVVADLLFHLDANYRIDGAAPSSSVLVSHPLNRPQHITTVPHPPPSLYLSKKPPSPSLQISYLQRAARSPLELFYKEQYAFSSTLHHEDSIFMQPWEVRSFLERDLLSQTPSHHHPSYHKAFSYFQASLRSLNINIQPISLHLLPTIETPLLTAATLFAPLINSSPSLIGAWNGLVTQGIVLFTDDWEKELFSRWPECALRTFLIHHHNIPIQHQAIIIKEGRTLTLPQSHTIHGWAEFAALSSTTPFPFTFDIIKLLLTHPSPNDIFQAIHDQAEGKRDPWPAFASTITADVCSLHLSQWKHYASLLWSDFFALLETS
jgi:hypothetical protein